MDLRNWGKLGQLEYIRQELCDRFPEGMSSTEIAELIGRDKSQINSFLIMLTYYCALYEERDHAHKITYFVDPRADESFDRQLPADAAIGGLT